MDSFNWFLLIFFVACVGFFAAGGVKKVVSSQHYFVSDRSTSLFALVATLVMTELNTSTLVGFAAMGSTYGLQAISLSLIFLVGLLFYALAVAKKWKEFNGVSVTSFFEQRYNRTLGYIATGVLGMAMLGFCANFLKSLTLLFSPLLPSLNQWVVSALLCGVMLLISVRGGLKSIIQFDKLSFFIVLFLFAFMFSTYFPNLKDSLEIASASPELSPMMVLSLICVTMFTYILAPWYGQKIFSARTPRIAFQAVLISSFIVAMLYGCIIFTAAIESNGSASSQLILPHLLSKLPLIFQGLAYGVIFFIGATTIVGLWNTMASVFFAHMSQGLEFKSLALSRGVTILLSLISYLLANLFVDKVFEKLILANIPISALSFSLLGGFYWSRVSSVASFSSILVGVCGGIGCYLYWGDPAYLTIWAFYVIPLHFLVGAIMTMLFPRRVQEDRMPLYQAA